MYIFIYSFLNTVIFQKKCHVHDGKDDSEIRRNPKRKIQMIKLWYISSLEKLLYSPQNSKILWVYERHLSITQRGPSNPFITWDCNVRRISKEIVTKIFWDFVLITSCYPFQDMYLQGPLVPFPTWGSSPPPPPNNYSNTSWMSYYSIQLWLYSPADSTGGGLSVARLTPSPLQKPVPSPGFTFTSDHRLPFAGFQDLPLGFN